MNVNTVDVLCDQTIDVVKIVKEAINVINESTFLTHSPEKFINRINSVVQYCYNLFINSYMNKHTDEQVNDLLINLMNKLVEYKNSYNPYSYGYKVMNSLLDVVKETFVELN